MVENLKGKNKMLETTAFIKVFYNFIVILISSMLAYLELDKEPMFFFAVLLVVDYITGLYKARILGHSITSNKLKYGCISKLLLLLIPIVLAIGAKSVGADMDKALTVGINILIISEIYSIIGNIYSARTKEEFPEWDAVAMIGKMIRNILLRLLGDKEDDKNFKKVNKDGDLE